MEFFGNFFGYNRRERRTSLIVVILIIIVLSVRIFFQGDGIRIEYYSLSDSSAVSELASERPVKGISSFDPNTAELEVLVSVGLSRSQANNLIRYRKAGGKFSQPEDIYRLYTVDSSTARKIIPYINIHGQEFTGDRGKSATGVGFTIDINRADSSDLVRLPGIGPVLASRIIKYRNLLGGYAVSDQLTEVYGISDSLFMEIESRITTDTALIRKIHVNSSEIASLARHPYISYREATEIFRMKKNGIVFKSVNDLVDQKIISPDKAWLLKYYLDFSCIEDNGN